MLTLTCFVSSLALLMLSAKIYKDLQIKIQETEELYGELKSKKEEQDNTTPLKSSIDVDILE